MSKQNFAELLYVVLEDDEDPFPVANTDISGYDDGTVVAIYQLVKKCTVRVTRELA